MNVSFLQELLNTVAEQGRQLLPRSFGWSGQKQDIRELSRALVSGRGEASGVVIAHEILQQYRALNPEERRAFFCFLIETMQPDPDGVARAARAYADAPGEATLMRLQHAVESPRQEFFRRLNLAPGATAEIVAMRRDLLRLPRAEVAVLDADLKHLLQSWFNRGFLVLRRIDWQTPAAILEKIIAYEAVHEIQGWDDLRRRLDPADRRCFAFFHPSLVDEPLIFVEVALMDDIPDGIERVLNEERKIDGDAEPSTAVFYSISNCQEGLRGISFGNFLIKQVVEELAKERASLKMFVTLSPVPQFARWLEHRLADDGAQMITPADRTVLQVLKDPSWMEECDEDTEGPLRDSVLALAAEYFLRAKAADGRPVDPVARFHLGNGARLERINWRGDPSEKGLREAHGLMVNYRYDLKEIEKNHEAYVNDGVVAASRQVRGLLRPEKSRVEQATKLLALPGRRTAGTEKKADGEAAKRPRAAAQDETD
ncbi:MAG: malonyl-CoA decarboxylase [Hyphomicrobiaceae bacterium]